MAHFLTEYQRYVGETEVPLEYFRWSALSLIAASLRDKVKVKWTERENVPANLYVVLLGPSGAGKEMAIATTAGLAKGLDPFNLYSGQLTSAGLHELLSGATATESVKRAQHTIGAKAEAHSMWVIMEEFRHGFRTGELAETLLAAFTQMYGGRDELPCHDMTRSRGFQELSRVCLNFLGGSTKEWFVRSVSGVEQVGGGLFARAYVAYYKRNPHVKIPRPQMDPQLEEITARLRHRLMQYTKLEGIVTLTDTAWQRYDDWYQATEPPDEIDETHIVWPLYFKRTKPILKFALLESIMRWDPGTTETLSVYDYRVHVTDVEKAIAWYDKLIDNAERAYEALIETPHSTLCRRIRAFIKKHEPVSRRKINHNFNRRGQDPDATNAALKTIESSGDVYCLNHVWHWRQ